MYESHESQHRRAQCFPQDRTAETLPTSLKSGRSQASVLDIWGTGPTSGEIRPGRLEPCPAKVCAVAGCQATMDLLLSQDEYPRGDSAHLTEWPYLYRRWVCRRDKTHFRNVSTDEWQAVKQFHVDAIVESHPSRLGPGAIVLMVVILPFALASAFWRASSQSAYEPHTRRDTPTNATTYIAQQLGDSSQGLSDCVAVF